METEPVTQGRAENGTPSLLTTIAEVRSMWVANFWETLCDAEGAWSQHALENL